MPLIDGLEPAAPIHTADGEWRCACGHPYSAIQWFVDLCPNCGDLLRPVPRP